MSVPEANFSSYQKGVPCAHTELYNTLQCNVKMLNHDVKECKQALKDYLIGHCPAVQKVFFHSKAHKSCVHCKVTFDLNTLLYFWFV